VSRGIFYSFFLFAFGVVLMVTASRSAGPAPSKK